MGAAARSLRTSLPGAQARLPRAQSARALRGALLRQRHRSERAAFASGLGHPRSHLLLRQPGHRLTDATRENERASAAAVFVLGYRLAILLAGGGALILSDQVSWQVVYRLMAGLMLLGPVVTFFSPEPEIVPKAPSTLNAALIEPLKEFVSRKGVLFSLVIVLTYKVGDSVAGHMLTPFLMDIGFSRTEIGGVQKVFGLIATIVGALLGGGFTARLGLRRALLIFGVLQAMANLLYAWLAHVGQSHLLLVTAIGVDNLMNGLGTAAFVALLMSLSDHRYTAFQYALLSSAMSVVGRLFGASGGYIAEGFGWPVFFILTTLLATPAILVLWARPLAEAARDPEATT
ncbi:MAG: AmpG family muropeptide MFS transporter [Deltaproteobacteria bacterium]|nr:AmpG family muropeptide MFS transporter [Deltaproteobacteria bacterium]